jgi:hypothetical protein
MIITTQKLKKSQNKKLVYIGLYWGETLWVRFLLFFIKFFFRFLLWRKPYNSFIKDNPLFFGCSSLLNC